MIYDRILTGGIDYQTYKFGRSNCLFRGPKPDLERPYVAMIGSGDVYGKFVTKPFSTLLQNRLGMDCANFSGLNAGVDLTLKDRDVRAACASAEVVVISIMGAHNVSNRLYRVHPRVNDRFIRPSKILRKVFPGVDYSDIHYTRHLLTTLRDANLHKFSIVVTEIKRAWVARMTTLIAELESKVILLWMANQPPTESGRVPWSGDLGPDPLFVDQSMIDVISLQVAKVVEVIVSPKAQRRGQKGMIFYENERKAAERMFGPAAHKEVAEALLGPIKALL